METNRKNKTVYARNTLLILFLAATTIVSSYLAYYQYDKRWHMEQQVELERSDIQQHLFDSYAKIEQNLAEITAHEGALQMQMSLDPKDMEGVTSPEERINREISMIESLVAENRQIIADLNTKVGDQDEQLKEYTNKVYGLNKRIKKYKAQADELQKSNKMLADNLAEVEDENIVLNFDNEQKKYQIEEQTRALHAKDNALLQQEELIHTAYYTVSSYPELKDANVLEKEGGVLGLGSTKTLKDGFDKSKFVKIDQREYTRIPVFSKKAELVTQHDSESYEWITEDDEVKWIKITDPEAFWESNKYLVIVTHDGWDLGFAQAE